MVGQRRAHGLVVDEVGASLLDVQATGESVVRVEETGVESGDDVLPLGALAGAVLREGFADVLAVVAVVVAVGVGHDVVGHRGCDLHGVVCQVHLQYVHLARQVGEFVVGVFHARVELYGLFGLPVVVGRQRPVNGVLLGVVVRLFVADGRGVHGRGGRCRSVLVGVVVADEAVSDAALDERCALVVAAGPAGTVQVRTVGRHVADNGPGVLAVADRAEIVARETSRAASQAGDDVSGIGAVLDDAACRGRTADQTAHALDAVFVLLSGVLPGGIVLDEAVVLRIGDGSLFEGSGQPAAASRGRIYAAVVCAVAYEIVLRRFDVGADASHLHARPAVGGVGDGTRGDVAVIDARRRCGGSSDGRTGHLPGDSREHHQHSGGVFGLERDRDVVGHVFDHRFRGECRHTCYGRAGSGGSPDGELVALDADREVPDGGLVQHAEQTVGRRFRGVGRPTDVFDRVSLAVELAREGILGRTDRRPFRRARHVYVAQQHHVAALVAVAVVAASGIDGLGEFAQVLGGLDAVVFGLRAFGREAHDADQDVFLRVAEHHGETALFERIAEGDGDGSGGGVCCGREFLGAHDFEDRFAGLLARDFVADRERLRGVLDDVFVSEHRVADLEDDVEGVEDRSRHRRAVAQRENCVAGGVARNACDERSFLAFGFQRTARRIGQPTAVDGPVTLLIDGHFGRASGDGDFGPVGVFQEVGFAPCGGRPVEHAAILLRAEDRRRGHVVLRGDGDAVFDVVGAFEADDIVTLGVLRDRGYDPAVDDGREQPHLAVEFVGLFSEFGELVVYLIDAFPQRGVVEVVAAPAREEEDRCQKRCYHGSFHCRLFFRGCKKHQSKLVLSVHPGFWVSSPPVSTRWSAGMGHR